MHSWLKFGALHLDDNTPSASFSGLKCTRMGTAKPLRRIDNAEFSRVNMKRPCIPSYVMNHEGNKAPYNDQLVCIVLSSQNS